MIQNIQNIPYKFNQFPVYYKNGGSPEPPEPPAPDYTPLTFTGKNASNAICLSSIGSPDAINLRYSKNSGLWTDYTLNNIITLSNNETVAFSGNNDHFSKDNNNYYRFQMTGAIEADGNVQALMNFSNSVTSSCYTYLFQVCYSLRTSPRFQATNLAEYCYQGVFTQCWYLSTAPSTLPATTLAEGCYNAMFWGCQRLINAPSLPATVLADKCYQSMFQGCKKLSSAPLLSATTLALSCYQYMFMSCNSLTAAPSLPATTLTNNCYEGMFYQCYAISTAPLLPATTLAPSCYCDMFEYCTSLTDAPVLSATTLTNICYTRMFRGCSNLSSINVAFTNWSGLDTLNWVEGVAANGTFTKPETLSTEYDNSRIPSSWTVVSIPEPLTFEILKDNSFINLNKRGNPPGGGFQYKINNESWKNYTIGQFFLLNTGDKISFRGTSNLLNSTDDDYFSFGYGGPGYPVTANFKVYGHINSMCNYSDELQTYQYCKLFGNDPRSYTWPHIVDASGVILPKYNNSDKSGVFRYLFASQTALRCGPNVSGTVIATEGVGYMFYNCSSLTAAPSFEPTVAGNHSFYRTFAKCSNLIVPPQINIQQPLVAGTSCIFKLMFSGCTSLTSTPYISMQNVTIGSFQNMFADCTSLISASELPASAINQLSYQGMFKGCTNLLSAPIMHFLRPATSGCQYMFSGCTNLKYINCLCVDWTKDANGNTMQYSFTDWVNGVQTTSGTFIKDSNLATEYRTSRIPNNWTVVNK